MAKAPTVLELLDQYEPKIKAAFIEAIEEVTSKVVIADVARALAKGDVKGAIEALNLDPAAFRSFQAALETTYSAMGKVAWTGTDDAKEQAIRRATAVMNSWNWQGYKRNNRNQALCWPRSDVIDNEGWGIPFNEVPSEVKNCCAELALVELVTPNAMTPVVVSGEAVKREKVGELEVEYASTITTAADATPQVSAAIALINEYLSGNSGSGMFGRIVRL